MMSGRLGWEGFMDLKKTDDRFLKVMLSSIAVLVYYLVAFLANVFLAFCQPGQEYPGKQKTAGNRFQDGPFSV